MKYFVVGCGLSGAVIARGLAEVGNQVTIWDRRNHIGGNMYDYREEHGILVQKYGPHTFHTNDVNLFNFMSKYEDWETYTLKCGAYWDNTFTPTPFNFKTIDQFFSNTKAERLKNKLRTTYSSTTVSVVDALDSTDSEIKSYAEYLFKMDYGPYTAKQWGMDPSNIDSSILKRVPLRLSYDEGYFDDIIQVMPKHSFTTFFTNLLDHPNIVVKLGVEAMNHLSFNNDHIFVDGLSDCTVVYTGALDQLFSYVYGKLPYRSLIFEWRYSKKSPIQPYPVVAYPQEKGFTRITDYSLLPLQNNKGSVYAIEYPVSSSADIESEPYYPVITDSSMNKYKKYLNLAEKIDNLKYCGRLGDFKYYNMDQALSRALAVLNSIR